MNLAFFWACLGLLSALSGCGGLGAATTSISGTVSGLSPGTNVVLGNSGEYLTVTANGPFNFSGQVKAGSAYNVTVVTNPVGGVCTVTYGSGVVGEYSEAVMNVVVTCVPRDGVIFGTVTGLATGATLKLADNFSSYSTSGTDSLQITANGPFAFETALVQDDSKYDVVVTSQPSGQTCDVADGSGAVPSDGGIQAIAITCH